MSIPPFHFLGVLFIHTSVSSEVRKSVAGMFLINLCLSLFCLNTSFIISQYAGSNEAACKAFSLFFHYFLLVACVALALKVLFTGWAPSIQDRLKVFLHIASLVINWSMCCIYIYSYLIFIYSLVHVFFFQHFLF